MCKWYFLGGGQMGFPTWHAQCIIQEGEDDADILDVGYPYLVVPSSELTLDKD